MSADELAKGTSVKVIKGNPPPSWRPNEVDPALGRVGTITSTPSENLEEALEEFEDQGGDRSAYRNHEDHDYYVVDFPHLGFDVYERDQLEPVE